MNQLQTKHLLLLIGSNPLPNAVAAERLATPETEITLLHSKELFTVAQRLQNWIKRRNRCEPNLKEIDESDPVSIFQGTGDALKEVMSMSIGLHYTGGTKAMSVHTYQAVKHWVEVQRTQGRTVTPVFSYLNPRKLQIVIDPLDPQSGESTQWVPAGLEPELKLAD